MINLQTAAEQHTCKLKGSRLDTLLKKMLRSDLVTNLGNVASRKRSEQEVGAAISGVQLLPTIVPQSATFNYTKVSDGHKQEGAGSIAQVWVSLACECPQSGGRD
jgi:hypothetical protein